MKAALPTEMLDLLDEVRAEAYAAGQIDALHFVGPAPPVLAQQRQPATSC
jgi:hypothetical protein